MESKKPYIFFENSCTTVLLSTGFPAVVLYLPSGYLKTRNMHEKMTRCKQTLHFGHFKLFIRDQRIV